jgi:hypothetical protein
LNSTFASTINTISDEKSWNSKSWTGHRNITQSWGEHHLHVSWQFLTTHIFVKYPGPNGVIMAKENFEVSNTCDKEFHKMVQTFGMTTEYARLKGGTDHNVLPNVVRSLPDHAFDTMWDSKKVRVHPPDPDKTTSIAVDLNPA